MRIARFEFGGKPRWGFVDDGQVRFAPQSAPPLADALALDVSQLAEIRAAGDESARLDEIRLLAPVPHPPQFVGIGLNYSDHADEAATEPPSRPQIFAFLSSSIIGPGDPIELPSCSDQVDWEVELAVVMGKPGRRIPAEKALDHVAGYTIVHDVSARDVQFADGQWTRAKSFNTFKPMGPWITTTDELGAADDLDLALWVNGEAKQSSSTSKLIFDVTHLIAYLSEDITLQTGSVISTGTPHGVGYSRQPPEFLVAGDDVKLEVEGIGTLENPVIAGSI